MVEVSSMFAASQPARNMALKQVQVKTAQEALMHVRRAITNFPKNVATQSYEKEQAGILVACAKMLYDNARVQILEALSEIDNRMAYWQYQKDHPWDYFVSKNPLKWVTGQKQEEEIENNLDTLKSHQGELYVLLGQLSELGNAFTHGYKDTFVADYTKAYAWIDGLLDTLVRIKTKTLAEAISSPFIARAELLKAKLENVNQLKNNLLADIPETAVPGYLTRNWFKSGVVLFGLGYGYKNFYDQITSALTVGQEKSVEYVINPVAATLKDVLTPGWRKNVAQDEILPHLPQSYKTQLNLAKEYVVDMGNKYALQEDAQKVLQKLDTNDYSGYAQFVEDVGTKESLELLAYSPAKSIQQAGKWAEGVKDWLRGHALGKELEGLQHFQDFGKYALTQKKEYEEQFAGVGKLVLLVPAVLAAGGSHYAYQKLTEKNYAPLRRALVDINSLFVDPSKPLNDEQYGKMIYLTYMLKKQAEKVLSQKNNIRADFIHDLERIELQEFNVAAKRAIVEDMFKKYDFLGLVQKK